MYAGCRKGSGIMKNQKMKILLLQLLTPLLAVTAAVLLSSVMFWAIGKDPLVVYATMAEFSLGRIDSIAAILFNATPLIFSGLAVAVGFRVGLFNIGVEGQYFIGAFCAALVGFGITGLPAWIHLPLAVLAAMAGGILWALIPIYLRIKRGVHEVISTIMLNYVAYSLIHYLIAVTFFDRNQRIPEGVGSPLIRTPKFAETVLMPKLNGLALFFGIELPNYVYLNWFFVFGLITAFGLFYLIRFTPLGFEIRAVGGNAKAAEAAGINPEIVYIKAFLISGAIAGLTGLSYLLCYYDYMDLDFPKSLGFNGIAVALMGNNNPLGIVLSALLFGFLNRGAEGVQTFLGVPMESVVIIQGIIILIVVIASGILGRYIKRLEKKEA
jgi:general nucleoside transport system permease protein